MNILTDSQNSDTSNVEPVEPVDRVESLKLFVRAVSNLSESLSRYFTNLSEKFLPLTEDKFELWEDDLKANAFLYRLLDSVSKGRSRIDADLLEEIRQFIGPWTPQKGKEDLAMARTDWQEILGAVRKNLANYGKTLTTATQTSETILTALAN